jgi:hypothetical protein
MGGPGITTVATRMAAFMQCQSFAMALLVAGASLAIARLRIPRDGEQGFHGNVNTDSTAR